MYRVVVGVIYRRKVNRRVFRGFKFVSVFLDIVIVLDFCVRICMVFWRLLVWIYICGFIWVRSF